MVENGVNFGERTGEDKTAEYETYFKNEIEYGHEFEGEVYLGELKENEKFEGSRFSLVVTNHKLEEKYILTYNLKETYPNEEKDGKKNIVYGKKGGKTYNLLDKVICTFNKEQKEGELKSRSVDFDDFRESFNKHINTMRFRADESTNAMAKEHHSPNFVILNIEPLIDLGD